MTSLTLVVVPVAAFVAALLWPDRSTQHEEDR